MRPGGQFAAPVAERGELCAGRRGCGRDMPRLELAVRAERRRSGQPGLLQINGINSFKAAEGGEAARGRHPGSGREADAEGRHQARQRTLLVHARAAGRAGRQAAGKLLRGQNIPAGPAKPVAELAEGRSAAEPVRLHQKHILLAAAHRPVGKRTHRCFLHRTRLRAIKGQNLAKHALVPHRTAGSPQRPPRTIRLQNKFIVNA